MRKYANHCGACVIRRAADRQATIGTHDIVIADRDIVKGTAWTAAEDALLKEMCERGCSTGEITQSLPGRTASAVEGRVHKLRRCDFLSRVYK